MSNAASPMIIQYDQIKSQYPDKLLFFRCGDFYEMFKEDALTASKALDLTLTRKKSGNNETVPMCGVPYHSVESYIARLMEKGFRVAICDQMEDPQLAKGIVKREVTRVISPGTVIEDCMLDSASNNYLCAVYVLEQASGLCFVDISTGELSLTDFPHAEALPILNELGRYSPREALLNAAANNGELTEFLKNRLNCVMSQAPELPPDECQRLISARFGQDCLSELGLAPDSAPALALAGTLFYLESLKLGNITALNRVNYYSGAQFMNLDLSSMRNLELLETLRAREKRGSILWVLDKTQTAMGKRLIKSWLEKPLVSPAAILKRQDAVAELLENLPMRDSLRQSLTGIFDLERLMTRITYGTANARELRSLYNTLQMLPEVKNAVSGAESPMLILLCGHCDTLEDTARLIEQTIAEEPPISVREGGLIKPGANPGVDELRLIMTDSKSVLAELEAAERARTGIKNLKVAYNRVFGYYIEISNGNKTEVPPDYVRRQTLTNCERYITPALKELEDKVLGAEAQLYALEYDLFDGVRKAVSKELPRIQQTAKAIARMDVLCSLALVAADNRYVRPEIALDGKIIIKDGRHPVVEAISQAPFVPNDTELDRVDNRCAIITGPNMAGKSTYIRQVAVIAVMAQIGSFVPAGKAHIGVVDAVFTRVGASDDLAAGQSTFMVEMNEVATIIKNATAKSLVILDEIGRGTSTFDGMSIAQAVLEYTVDKKKLGAKTLFATHYHELTELESILDGVKNYNIAVKKRGDEITFLRRIVRGGADDSYGIEVAKLAGVPDAVVNRAKQILSALEAGETVKFKGAAAAPKEMPGGQTSLFAGTQNPIIQRLAALDINVITPIEALRVLHELSAQAKDLLL
ncbi:MAG: DNA mismatch repair protein MutS [Oscillospiraceae bacterium]|jgi:DNA mismatch repair protein MutS|nr:DNA mismatch repair protein MutS [Oscillospiraceae bacterium]